MRRPIFASLIVALLLLPALIAAQDVPPPVTTERAATHEKPRSIAAHSRADDGSRRSLGERLATGDRRREARWLAAARSKALGDYFRARG